jgi:hypothetical protein
MPAKKANKKSGKSRGRPTRGPTRAKSIRSKGASRSQRMPRARTGMTTAPAAVSGRAKMSFNFSGSNGGQHLVAGATLPFCFLGSDMFSNGMILSTGAGTSAPAAVCLINPQNLVGTQKDAADPPTLVAARWLAPQVSLMTIAFDRYRVSGLEFIYEPCAPTSTVDRLVFAYAEDPIHPVLSGITAGAATTVPAQTDLLITPNSVSFAPWISWNLRVPVEKRDQDFYVTLDGTSAFAATARQVFHGVVACRSSTTVAAITYGILYARVIYELIDPVPVVGTIAPITRAVLEARGPLKRSSRPDLPVESKVVREPDDDIENIESPSPPRYVPSPSTALGTAGWFGSASPTVPTPLKKPSLK